MSIIQGLRAALLLGCGRPEGAELVGNDHPAVIFSFWAMLLCLPSLLFLGLIQPSAHLTLEVARLVVRFAVSWLVFVAATHHMAHLMGKQTLWPRFIAVWAWCSVLENTAVALGGLPGPLGLPPMIGQVAFLISLGWALWLEWYAIRLTLKVEALTAVALVVFDITIGEVMAAIGAMTG